VVAAAQPALQVRGRWKLDEIRTRTDGSRFTPNSVNGGGPGELFANSTVSLSGGPIPNGVGLNSVNFVGWRDDPFPYDNAVDPTASALTVASQARYTTTGQRFKISAWIRPADSSTVGAIPDNESPNIIQKGLASNPDGQWKMSL
jgi:hypothetical protein